MSDLAADDTFEKRYCFIRVLLMESGHDVQYCSSKEVLRLVLPSSIYKIPHLDLFCLEITLYHLLADRFFGVELLNNFVSPLIFS